MIDYDVLIIGGGAAGLMASLSAVRSGARVLILEKKRVPGLKLGITGKGRCNLTNIAPVEEFMERFGKNGRFLRQAFNEFFSEELIALFSEIGIKTKTERGGRVFPENEDAVALRNTLVNHVKKLGVEIKTSTGVKEIIFEDNKTAGVITTNGHTVHSPKVIIATGGMSYPGTGSTGDGYSLAESAGHRIIPVRPALIPLTTGGDTAQKLQGLSLKNVAVKLLIDGRRKHELFGEMLFTHFGLSGPVILTLSKFAVDAINAKKKAEVSIDLKPALDEQKLDNRLQRDFAEQGKKQFDNILKGLLPRLLIDVCIDQTAIPAEKPGNQLKSSERGRLLRWLKDFRLNVTGYRPMEEAVITAGGVDTREIDPRTMGSKLVKGLYFAGEVIDIDADTGGYNLQAAFSTGWVAGRNQL